MTFLSKPKIHFLPKGVFRFRQDSKKMIQAFFTELEKLYKEHQKIIIIEFKIVFHAHGLTYLEPAKESKFIYKTFAKHALKIKKKLKFIVIKPQLRSRLSGKSLKQFKRELQSLYLVSRKRDTGFEYHLWTVALHATTATYAKKIKKMRHKLLALMWQQRH